MGAFEILEAEHEAIGRVLRGAATWAARLGARRDARAELRALVAFLAEHVDAVHHGKEEAELSARMREHGFSRATGPVAAMLREHAEERALLDALARHGARREALAADEIDEIARTVASWVDHMARHIEKEERVLYPMVREKLPAEALAALDDDFRARGADAERARIEGAARALVARLAAGEGAFAEAPAGSALSDATPPPSSP